MVNYAIGVYSFELQKTPGAILSCCFNSPNSTIKTWLRLEQNTCALKHVYMSTSNAYLNKWVKFHLLKDICYTFIGDIRICICLLKRCKAVYTQSNLIPVYIVWLVTSFYRVIEVYGLILCYGWIVVAKTYSLKLKLLSLRWFFIVLISLLGYSNVNLHLGGR